MPPGIPEIARPAALEYLRGISRVTVQRGEDYIARKRVRKIAAFPDEEIGFYANVTGTGEYEVIATFDREKARWECECDCPVSSQCKHCYAVMKTLVDRSPAPAAPKVPELPKPASGPLVSALVKALGRKLDDDENEYLHKIGAVFAKAKAADGILANDFATLGFKVPGFHWDRVAAWSAFPADELEFWHYVILFMETLGVGAPRWMRALEVPAAIRDRVGKWRRSREVDRWKKLLSRLPEAEPELPQGEYDLRVRFFSEEAVVEVKRPGAPDFEPMKAAAFRQLPDIVTSTLTPEGSLLRQLLEERADFGYPPAMRYLEQYFGGAKDGPQFTIYWGSAENFLKELKQHMQSEP